MNMLFIPHVPNLKVINRVYELAKSTDSYFLYWEIDNSSLKHKIISQLQSLRFRQDNKIVQIPLLFKPEKLSIRFNTMMLNHLIDKLDIDVVINANALLFDIANIKVPVFYDMVDDHLEVNDSIGLTPHRVKKIEVDLRASKGVLCVTSLVEEKVKPLNAKTITLENGLYFERFNRATSRKKLLGLEGKKVFGFIGGIEEWTGLEEAIVNYLKIKSDSTAFLVVGGNEGSYFKRLKERYAKDIDFVGAVSPLEVADYFKSIDVGLIPFVLNDFTNNALPIKALEYGYMGKPVISTPLVYLKQSSFPFIYYAPIERFDRLMQQELTFKPFAFDGYDWSVLGKKLEAFVSSVEGVE